MSDDLVSWLGQQLDEDERVAQALSRACRQMGREPDFFGAGGPAAEAFWSRFTPARVLRAVEGKRAMVEMHSPIDDPVQTFRDTKTFLCSVCTNGSKMYDQDRGILFTDLTVFPCTTLRLLAAEYADRPGYREEWKP